MHTEELRVAFQRLLQDGIRLAGGLPDLPQRAAVYHHVFHDSGRNHVFPLIAAHGALWARGYFAFGLRLTRFLSWQYALDHDTRNVKVAAVETFANVLRDINRRVCADTYATYHFAAAFGRRPYAAEVVSPDLLEALDRIHAARQSGRELSDCEKLAVFRTHFLREQETVVGPTIEQALRNLEWPLMRCIALKPLVRFAYFPRGERIWFSDFSSRDERVANGLKAFEIAARRGWQATSDCLRSYAVMPEEFFADNVAHFAGLRHSLLATQ